MKRITVLIVPYVLNTDSEMVAICTANIFPPFDFSKGNGPQPLAEFGIRSIKQTVIHLEINIDALFEKNIGLEVHAILAVVEHFSIEHLFFVKTAPCDGCFASMTFIGSFFHKPYNPLQFFILKKISKPKFLHFNAYQISICNVYRGDGSF